MAKADDKQTEMLLEVVRKQQEQINALLAVKGGAATTTPAPPPGIAVVAPAARPRKQTLPEKIEAALRSEPLDPQWLAQRVGESRERTMEAVRELVKEGKVANMDHEHRPCFVWRIGPEAPTPKDLREYVRKMLEKGALSSHEISVVLGFSNEEMRGKDRERAERPVWNAVVELQRTPGIAIEKYTAHEGGHGAIWRIDTERWQDANTGPKKRTPAPKSTEKKK